ncbi:Ig-like domain-containing protein [Mycolicibacterium sp. 050158]|uniref:Ig-like domain-containing protein n=1 Tax=Mycolicibacterium sp. 050158 TaxID=3090602 RepID=UPI00299DDEC6|nr:Ig-like domain-containing protein [Mycolicibacterium sp. 050158]MDX1892726.1 Ig-like domain-containing protein [Mycolicibacterium sp. 050158]
MPYGWLGAGAVTLGIGAAMLAGSGVAQADDSSGGSTSESSSAQGGTSSSGQPSSTEQSTNEASAVSDTVATPHPKNGPDKPAATSDDGPATKVGDGRNGTTHTTPTKTASDDKQPSVSESPAKDSQTTSAADSTPKPTASETSSPSASTPAATSPSAGTATTSKEPEPVPVWQAAGGTASHTSAPTATPTVKTVAAAQTASAMTASATVATSTSSVTPMARQQVLSAAAAPANPFDLVRNWIFRTFLNQSPTVAAPAGQAIQSDGTITGMVTGADGDGDVLTYTASKPTRGTVAIDGTGAFVYTPGANFTGADTFTVTVSDDSPVNGWHVHGLLGLFFPGRGSTATTTVSVVGPAVTPNPPSSGNPSTGTPSAATIYGWGTPDSALSDEFDGNGTPASFWDLYYSPGHAGNGLRRPGQITEQNGYLQIAGTSNATSGGMMSSAVYPAYGRWEVSMRVDDQGAGNPYHSVVALIPYGVPYDNGAGDLDFSEADVNSDRAYVFIHHPTAKQSYASVSLDLAEWHTYSIEVAPDHISWFVDGKVQTTTTNPAAITGTKWTTNVQLDAFYSGGLAPSNMQVDYFRFYPLPASGAPIVPAPAPAIGDYRP